MKDRVHCIDRRFVKPRMPACDHLVENDSEREQVAARVDFLPEDLLWRHVSNGSHNLPGSAHARARGSKGASPRNLFCQTKIQHFYIAIEANHDVGRFEIAVMPTLCAARSASRT